MLPIRRNLNDDAWNKVTSIPLLVRSLFNIQINQHHPEDKNKGLLYSIKYPTKPEPSTKLCVSKESDDIVTNYFKAQLVSVSSAMAFLLEDPITDCSRDAGTCLYPSWSLTKTHQGSWRRYALRIPFAEGNSYWDGYDGKVSLQALKLSILFAPALRLIRYFKEDRLDSPDDGAHPAALPVSARKGNEQCGSSKSLGSIRIHPARVERRFWDGSPDVPRHRWYDPVFTQLLPGQRLVFTGGHKATDVW